MQRFGISSSASPQPNEKESSQSQSEPGSTKENGDCEASVSADSHVQDEKDESGSDMASNDNMNENVKRRRRRTKQTVFSDSDLDTEDLSRDDLVKLVAEKEELLKMKDGEFQKMQDKVLRTYAEMENVMNRTKREAENSKKFAIQVSFSRHILCQGVMHLLLGVLYVLVFCSHLLHKCSCRIS